MSINAQVGISDGSVHPVSRCEQCAAMTSSDEQPDCLDCTHARRGTDDIFYSTSTLDPKKRNESFDTSTSELQRALDAPTPPPHPPIEPVDEKATLIHERVTPGRWQRFCLDWISAYRVLVSGVVVVNLGVLISRMIFNPVVEAPLTATAANIMVAVLLRQEDIINLAFTLVSKLSATLPLAVRRTIGGTHHYGGLHIGCALSALLWYIMFTGLNTVRVLNLLQLGYMTTPLYIDITTAYVALLAILLVCASAIPQFRARFHNTFEATHRFGGWVALLILWIHAGITTMTPDASVPLYAHRSLWLLFVTTLLLLLPWLRIRRVPITSSLVSTREIQLIFPYPSMPYTSTLRFSTAPLTEWHAFATIPINDTTAKIIISRAGDWTSSIITAPPVKLWIRSSPTLNFLAFAPLFNNILLVATGAGIGPMLSLLASPSLSRMRSQGRKIKVMWCVYDPYAAHWAFVLKAIKEVDPDARIFDSKSGRPDVAFEARWLAQKEEVEVVMVVSNPKVTKEVVHECKMSGLAAYGAVFDS